MEKELFEYFKTEHNVTLLSTDIEAIIRIVVSSSDKPKNIIKKVRKREEEAFKQSVFCREHNFLLEAEKYKSIKNELRAVCRELQSEFETGYISVE